MGLGVEHAFVGVSGFCELSGERGVLEGPVGEYASSSLRKCTGFWHGRFFYIPDSGKGYFFGLLGGEFAGGDGIFPVAEGAL